MDSKLEKFVLGSVYLISLSLTVLGLGAINPHLDLYTSIGLVAIIFASLAASALSFVRKIKLRLPLSWEVWPVVIGPLTPLVAFLLSPLWMA